MAILNYCSGIIRANETVYQNLKHSAWPTTTAKAKVNIQRNRNLCVTVRVMVIFSGNADSAGSLRHDGLDIATSL